MSAQPTIVIGEEMSGPTFDTNTTTVMGIVCKKCNNELPPMTMQQHLDGDFNKKCPHTSEVTDLSCCGATGDVRDMCFCRLGDLPKLTLMQVVQVRQCPNLTYAVAYWLTNNFGVSEVRKDAPGLSTFWRKRRDIVQYLGLIIRDGDEFWALKEAIEAMEKDEDGRGGCE